MHNHQLTRRTTRSTLEKIADNGSNAFYTGDLGTER